MTPLALYHYERTSYRSILGVLWHLMEREGATAKVFHAQQGPAAERGDLVEFVRYFDDPKRYLLMAVTAEAEPVGMVWFDDVVMNHRAAVNIFYARKVWGRQARATTADAVTWAFRSLGVSAIYGYTPWRTAVRHGQSLGFHIVATLTGYAFVDGAPKDVTILRMLRAEWDKVHTTLRAPASATTTSATAVEMEPWATSVNSSAG
jgi:RimJ/RimL family protein N-acetyltransferase